MEVIIDSLVKVYGQGNAGTRAVDGISLALTNGMFGLLGPNGAAGAHYLRCSGRVWPMEKATRLE